jgi:hypothetical protein
MPHKVQDFYHLNISTFKAEADEYDGETFIRTVIFHSPPLKNGYPEHLILLSLEQLTEVTTLIIFNDLCKWFNAVINRSVV